MAITMVGKVTVKGKITEGGADKSTTVATFNNLSASAVDNLFGDRSETAAFLKKVQEVTSATVTGVTFSMTPSILVDQIGTPGDELDASEIFSQDYSDTAVVPTLNIVNVNGENTKRNFNVKYMADPVNTENFETKVRALASALADLGDTVFVSANLTFTAKDEIMKTD